MPPPPRTPLSRNERQRLTRESLVFAAREVFARDGYHGASLDEIASDAGFSKGAVYSNFDDKAALFLAVMDVNLATALSEGWDPFEPVSGAPEPGTDDAQDAAELAEAIRGFALATLEFIATAARDERLAAELAKRLELSVGVFTDMAREHRAPDEELDAHEVGALIAALDQGAALLALGGNQTIGPRLRRIGLRRLLDPLRAHAGGEGDGDGGASLHDQVIEKRIADAIREL